jgi:hypothetical protein
MRALFSALIAYSISALAVDPPFLQQDARVVRQEFLAPNADLVDQVVARPAVKVAWALVAQAKCR